MTHEDLWRALDTLAAEKGLSPSGLARSAGLDPTSFNRSKRIGPNGPRWPSTESLSRVLAASGIGLDAFASLVAGARVLASRQTDRSPMLPVRMLSRLGRDATLPSGEDDTGSENTVRMMAPVPMAAVAYLVRVDLDCCEPALREGALLVVCPEATVRPGDRAIAFTGHQAVACVAHAPAPLRLDGNGALSEPAILHRIDWIGL